jgi:nuclear GTP-binding protein
LTGSAVSLLRDWNSGKIPYSTVPPTLHPSSAPAPTNDKDVEMSGEQVGNAQILNTLSEAFTLEGLLDDMGDEAAWDGEVAAEGDAMAEECVVLWNRADSSSTELLVEQPPPVRAVPPVTAFSMDSASDSEDDMPRPIRPLAALSRPSLPVATTLVPRNPQVAPSNKLFTPEELAVLPEGMLGRQKQKQLAKKAKKKRAAAEQTEGELMLGFMGMGVEEPEAEDMEEDMETLRPSAKKIKRDKKKRALAKTKIGQGKKVETMDVDDDARKEADFASFLAGVGGERVYSSVGFG